MNLNSFHLNCLIWYSKWFEPYLEITLTFPASQFFHSHLGM